MILHVDHCGPIDKQRLVKQHIFLIINAFTKFTKLYAVKTTASKEVINCLLQYFAYYSKPAMIISDRGSAFTSKEFEDFITVNDIKHVKIATGSPKANGQAERVNRALIPMLSKVTDNSINNYWYKVLDEVECALNNMIHKTTGEIPSKLLFGVVQRGKITDKLREFIDNNVNNKEQSLEEIRNSAAEKIEEHQKYSKNYFDKKRKTPHEYRVGDYVMIRNFENTPGVSKKLIPPFKGPYKIIKKLRNDRYVVADVEGHQMTQRPYSGT
ncbi:Pro-Pol polyprotein [Trachymyrmex cornetzi]|uniref:Pro-Pol polyprotein n=1 Tax=Trachymyrmex cornetzi TaxID=471704 RepID=A0A151JSY4_9HYME|nr:Pro-Pol polyprotein [Trachymyrmex cornetzi]